jgi:hypothetical protein
LRRRQRREYLISPRSSQRKVNRWFGHNAQQNRAKSSVWKYMPVSFLLKIHSSRSNSRSRRLRVVVRDNGCGMEPQVVRSGPIQSINTRAYLRTNCCERSEDALRERFDLLASAEDQVDRTTLAVFSEQCDDGRTGISSGSVTAMKHQDSCCFPKGSMALFLLET